MPVLQRDSKTEDYIRNQSIIFGRKSQHTLTRYQQEVNTAAQELALQNPTLLQSRGELLVAARSKVDSSGYTYVKGKSRSKHACPEDRPSSTPKRRKTTDSVRLQRLSEIDEDVKDLSDTLMYKEKRREQASNLHNYKTCDDLTQEISELKARKRLLLSERQLLERRQQQSRWYKRKTGGLVKDKSSSSVSDAEVSDISSSGSSVYPATTPSSSADTSLTSSSSTPVSPTMPTVVSRSGPKSPDPGTGSPNSCAIISPIFLDSETEISATEESSPPNHASEHPLL